MLLLVGIVFCFGEFNKGFLVDNYLPIYFVFFIVLLLSIVEQKIISQDRIVMAVVSIFALCFLLALRAPGFGNDDLSYVDIFKDARSRFSLDRPWFGYDYQVLNVEFGYYIFLVFLSFFGVSSILIFGFNGLVSLGFFYGASRRFYPYFMPVLLIYISHHFLTKDLNALRLAIASSVVAYSASYVIKKNYFLSFFWILMASLVQISALLAVIPLVLAIVNFSLRTLLTASFVLLVLNYFYPATTLVSNLPMLEFVSYKFELYSGADMYNYSIGIFDPVNIKNFIVVFFGFLMLGRLSGRYPGFKVALIFFFSGAFLRILFSDFAILAGRGYSVLSVFECWVIAALAIELFGKKIGLVVVTLYAFLIMSLNFYMNTQWRGDVGFYG